MIFSRKVSVISQHPLYVEIIFLEIRKFKRFPTIWYKEELSTTYILWVLSTAKIYYWSSAIWKEIQSLRSFIIILFARSLRQWVMSKYIHTDKSNIDTNVLIAGLGYTKSAQDWQIPLFITICGFLSDAKYLSSLTLKGNPQTPFFHHPS